MAFTFLFADLSVWNKSLSQRWRRIRRRCSSFTTTSATHTNSPETHLQKQFLLDTSASSVESPRVVCATDSPSPLRNTKDTEASKCNADESGTAPASANGLADVSHLLRTKFNKFQNGFRKRRAMSVHESLCVKDAHQTTFYVPTPLEGEADEDEEADEVDSGPLPPPLPSSLDARRAASPLEPLSLPATALIRIPPCSRVSYRKSPSECSSGRGTATPTEELDNDSSGGSNHSSKSFRFRKHSYEERLERSSQYWDQGYHSIEYSPENIPYRYGSSGSGRASRGEQHQPPAQPTIDEPGNVSLFRDQCSIPATSIRLSSKCERVPTSAYVCSAGAYRPSPPDTQPKYRNSCVYSYDNYRGSDFEGAPNGASRYQSRREAVSNYDGRAPTANYESNGLNCALRVNGHPAIVRRSLPGERLAPGGLQAAPARSSVSRFNVSDSSVDLRRRPINVHDIDEDDFDEELILRNEPKMRSCRRWSQADTLAMDAANATRPHPLANGFRIGERVTTCQLPYAALQSIEPLSMPYNPAPPIPTPPRNGDKTSPPSASKVAGANMRRRSARSVSPESRKKETEAREKRQQIVHNLQKYVDQRCRNMVGCKSNADLSNTSENDFWKKEEDVREKVSAVKLY